MFEQVCKHCGQSSFMPGICPCQSIFFRVEDFDKEDVWHQAKGNLVSLLEDDFSPIAELAARNAYKALKYYEEASFIVFVRRRDKKPKKYIVDADFPPVAVEFSVQEAR